MNKLLNLVFLLSCIFLTVCKTPSNNGDELLKLTQFCIRSCVLETSAPEICDTRCMCAAKKIQQDMGEIQLKKFISDITSEKSNSKNAQRELAKAIQICTSSD